MLKLDAVSIGFAIPSEGSTGQVHSTFERAINFVIDQGDGLLTTVTSNEVHLPQGIQVVTPPGFSFETIKIGETIHFTGNTCQVGSMTIQLACARIWKCDLPALDLDLKKPEVMASWKTAWTHLARKQKTAKADLVATDLFDPENNFKPGFSKSLKVAIRKLVDATSKMNLDLAVASASALIGLGAGLTPTGDDFLVGYLAGLWCQFNLSRDIGQFCENFGNQILQQTHATNAISRTFLHHAARGQVSSLLEGLARQIINPTDPKTLIQKVDLAMQVGASSGTDGVCGLLVGMGCFEKAWEHK